MLFKYNFLIALGLIAALSTAAVCFADDAGYGRTPRYCDVYARDYADHYSNPGGNVVGGALGGAALGALLGGIAGGGRGAGTGAAIGGGVGALSGGAAAANDRSYLYNRAYDRCMNGDPL